MGPRAGAYGIWYEPLGVYHAENYEHTVQAEVKQLQIEIAKILARFDEGDNESDDDEVKTAEREADEERAYEMLQRLDSSERLLELAQQRMEAAQQNIPAENRTDVCDEMRSHSSGTMTRLRSRLSVLVSSSGSMSHKLRARAWRARVCYQCVRALRACARYQGARAWRAACATSGIHFNLSHTSVRARVLPVCARLARASPAPASRGVAVRARASAQLRTYTVAVLPSVSS